MNFVKHEFFVVRISNNQSIFSLFLIVLLSIYLAGCSDGVRLPSVEQLTEFENAGPIRPSIDLDRLVRAKIGKMPYRIVPGDVLEVSISPALQVSTTELPGSPGRGTPYMCRVSDNGAIRLPVVGEIEVAGKTFAEIESAIIDACYPKYCANRPYVFVRAVEVERLEPLLFTVIGLVNQPGNFPYPSNVQYNLMQAVGFAGGFNQAAEPRYATVYRIKADGTITSVTFKVVDASDASKLTNASNVLIKPGDIVAVEHTPRTRTNLFLNSLFRIQVGALVPVGQ